MYEYYFVILYIMVYTCLKFNKNEMSVSHEITYFSNTSNFKFENIENIKNVIFTISTLNHIKSKTCFEKQVFQTDFHYS